MNSGFADLCDRLANELAPYIIGIDLESEIDIKSFESISYTLEYFLPLALANKYVEWEWQALDEVFVDYSRKMSAETIEIAGTVILIDDQAMTPFYARITLSESFNSIISYQIYLGESGGGYLGISGSPLNRASKNFGMVGMYLEKIKWKYSAGGFCD